jgi:hypothetical protein
LYKVDETSGYWFLLGLDRIPNNLYNNLVGASIKYLLILLVDALLIFNRDSKRNPIDAGLSPQVFIPKTSGLYPSNFKRRPKEILINDSSKTAVNQ